MKQDVIDTAKVWVVSMGGIMATLTNIEAVLKVLVLLASLGFTIYKWYQTYKHNQP